MSLLEAVKKVDACLDRYHNHTVAVLFAASLAARVCEGGIECFARVLARGDAGFLLLLVFVVAVLWSRDGLR